jgi:hypothetical protein
LFLVADKVDGGKVVVGLERAFDSLNDDLTTVVAAHDIHCDAHSDGSRKRHLGAAERSSAGRDRQDLTSLVVTTGGTDPVRHIRRCALRARAELRQLEDAVIRAAHAHTAF